MLTAIPGVSCVKPQAALYMFPKLDPKMYPIVDDQQFITDLLLEERTLLVQGTGFQLADAGSFPRGVSAERGRSRRLHQPYRALSRWLSKTSLCLTPLL